MAPDGNGALSQNGCLHTSEKYPATGGGNATPTQGADTRLPPGIFRACGDQPHLPFNAAEKKRSHQIHSSELADSTKFHARQLDKLEWPNAYEARHFITVQ